MQDEKLTEYITTTEAAALTGKDESTFRHAALDQRIPALKVGRDWLFLRRDVERVFGVQLEKVPGDD